ncbi:uncharacterized protein SPPG_00859 [Spizellomyces punctatus DAOM BR117]|uniref:poly(ADP-ribose) glycohydrolase n=1 Tax=Spizellomyces punctatus (strain DAOM BR117) TaxID=645134 RepID=A0A0L0HWD6_SPIPD|nr:uncharacterized protein SPPG_00859 [Spizellomyces punctatus DAOM BR117]KND05199.1 hypothetical protein SPPG_00859 [Spizellomyces punctatus DAOM BR117]|eukprot:XP_016613238.1 hypothetical protein SPPG_00859 [Spizellomyces punctatus DAOM BR117]
MGQSAAKGEPGHCPYAVDQSGCTMDLPESISVLPSKSATVALLGELPPSGYGSLHDLLTRQLQILFPETHVPPSALAGLQVAITRFEDFMRTRRECATYNFYADLLPLIHRWATDYNGDEGICVRTLRHGEDARTCLTRRTIRHILAQAFFINVLPLNQSYRGRLGEISFHRIYVGGDEVGIHRTLCLLSYFEQNKKIDQTPQMGAENVSFTRRTKNAMQIPQFASLARKIDVTRINVHTGRMESSDASAIVDFANRRLHVHSIIPSATQEEILFSCCPEAFVGLLFCETISDDEVIIISNVKRFSEYTGYGDTFQFAGFYNGSPRSHTLLALDACTFRHFDKAMVDRDLRKAYMAFSYVASTETDGARKITTSHWGCGIFGGEIHLKFLQQVLAASSANVGLDYSTFGNAEVQERFKALLAVIKRKEITAGQVYAVISGYNGKREHFYEYVTASFGA